MTSLQIEIDAALERDFSNSKKRKLNVPGTSAMMLDVYDEHRETNKFIEESTFDVIKECLNEEDEIEAVKVKESTGLKPDLIALCTVSEKEQHQLAGKFLKLLIKIFLIAIFSKQKSTRISQYFGS